MTTLPIKLETADSSEWSYLLEIYDCPVHGGATLPETDLYALRPEELLEYAMCLEGDDMWATRAAFLYSICHIDEMTMYRMLEGLIIRRADVRALLINIIKECQGPVLLCSLNELLKREPAKK